MTLGVRKTKLLGVAVVAFIAAGAAGCSSLPSVPDWVDPTSWFAEDSNASAADNAQTPELASLPDKPEAPKADDQREVAEQLAADRNHATYSAEALRGGTEAAAAPPPDVAPAQVASAESEEIAAAKQAKAAAAVARAQKPTRVADRSIAQDPTGSTAPGTLPATAGGNPVAVASADNAVQTAALPEPAPQPAAQPARTRVAAAEPVAPPAPPPGAQGVLPPTRAVPVPVASINPTDAELGFKPSSAPALDPTVSQFVAAPILDHYRQTAANAGMRASAPRATGYAAASKPAKLRKPAGGVAMGGPETMTGNVVANFDALQPTATSPTAPSVYASQSGLPATAVVFFPNDTVSLSSAGRAQVHAAVEQFKSGGGKGYIRVVGHSSSRTPNMTASQHLEIIFRKSQARANAVAQAIIHEGIPADKVLVEAVGDTQPVYYESMPKGEDGNRRAEIFLQG